MTYTGKMFEQDFFSSWKSCTDGTYLTRLYDPTNGFKGIQNPCDFILACEVGTVYLELKATKQASLSFSNVSDRQWQSLLDADASDYAVGGLLVFFYEKSLLRWYPIQQLEELRKAGAKSINPDKLPNVGYPVKFYGKRVRCTFDIYSLVEAIQLHYKEALNVEQA